MVRHQGGSPRPWLASTAEPGARDLAAWSDRGSKPYAPPKPYFNSEHLNTYPPTPFKLLATASNKPYQ